MKTFCYCGPNLKVSNSVISAFLAVHKELLAEPQLILPQKELRSQSDNFYDVTPQAQLRAFSTTMRIEVEKSIKEVTMRLIEAFTSIAPSLGGYPQSKIPAKSYKLVSCGLTSFGLRQEFFQWFDWWLVSEEFCYGKIWVFYRFHEN